MDLNNDNVLDIVLGTAAKEEEFTDTAVIALDGASGKPLWAIQGHNQYVGAAVFQDITNDHHKQEATKRCNRGTQVMQFWNKDDI